MSAGPPRPLYIDIDLHRFCRPLIRFDRLFDTRRFSSRRPRPRSDLSILQLSSKFIVGGKPLQILFQPEHLHHPGIVAERDSGSPSSMRYNVARAMPARCATMSAE